MSRYKDLAAIGLAVMLSFGLVACGGGGGQPGDTGDTGDTGMMSLAEKETAATSALDAAKLAVDAVMDDSAMSVVTNADTAIGKAKTAVAAASDSTKHSEFSRKLGMYEGILMTAKESRTDAMDVAQGAAVKDALALFNGINEIVTNLTVVVESVADKHGGGMASVMVTDTNTDTTLRPGVGGAGVKKSAEPMLSSMWQGTMLTDTNADDESSTVVVYSDIVAPKPVPFDEEYTLVNGNLVILPAHGSKIKASAFMHTGRMNHDPDPDSDADIAMIRGTFNGASGEYRCTAATPTSCASHDAGDGAVRLDGTGTWVFDPDSGAMAMMADPSYAYFGWWLNKGTAAGVEAGVFHGVTDGDGNEALLAVPATDAFTALGGEATYTGAAAGKYAINPGLSDASGGHWTADATLTADFGAEDDALGMISGMVDQFMAGGQTMDWSVKLGETDLTATGTFDSSTGDDSTGDDVVWTIGGVAGAEDGSWMGGLRAEGDDNRPTVATGMFTATHGAVGHMLGAFGAHIEE